MACGPSTCIPSLYIMLPPVRLPRGTRKKSDKGGTLLESLSRRTQSWADGHGQGWFGKSFPWETTEVQGAISFLEVPESTAGPISFLFLRFHGSYANLHYGYLPMPGGPHGRVVTNTSACTHPRLTGDAGEDGAEAGSLMPAAPWPG